MPHAGHFLMAIASSHKAADDLSADHHPRHQQRGEGNAEPDVAGFQVAPVVDDTHREELRHDDRQHHHPAAAVLRQAEDVESGADLQVVGDEVQAPQQEQSADGNGNAAYAPAQQGGGEAVADGLSHLHGEDEAVDDSKRGEEQQPVERVKLPAFGSHRFEQRPEEA